MAASYDQECPVARALDIVGERWSLLVIRDLLRHGPLKFQEMEQRLSGIGPNTLSARLKSLEHKGAIGSRLYTQHPPRLEYFLTEKGMALGPVVKALFQWGQKHGRT